jgi:hypothetical protein
MYVVVMSSTAPYLVILWLFRKGINNSCDQIVMEEVISVGIIGETRYRYLPGHDYFLIAQFIRNIDEGPRN